VNTSAIAEMGVAAHLTQQVIGLGDELHVDVLNAVVR